MLARTRLAGWVVPLAALCLSGCQQPETPATGRIERTRSGPTAPVDPASIREADAPKISPDTHLAAGRLHESQGRLPAAAEQYQMAVEADPKHVEALNRLGVVMTRLGQYRKAEKVLQRAIELAPDQAYLLNNLAYTRMAEGRWREAVELLARAVEKFPDFPRARINLAVSLAMQGEDDRALEQFSLALPIEDAYYNMGMLYQSRREIVKAAHAYKLALQANPRLTAASRRLEKLPAEILGEADRRIEAGLALTEDGDRRRPAADAVAMRSSPPEAAPATHATSKTVDSAAEPVAAMLDGGGQPLSAPRTQPAGLTDPAAATVEAAPAGLADGQTVLPMAMTGHIALDTGTPAAAEALPALCGRQSSGASANASAATAPAPHVEARPGVRANAARQGALGAVFARLSGAPAWPSARAWTQRLISRLSRFGQAASPPAPQPTPAALSGFMPPGLQAFSGEDPVP